jgi:hypothetical protein
VPHWCQGWKLGGVGSSSGAYEKGRRGSEKESLWRTQRKRNRGGDGGAPADQRMTEGGQFARERGPYVPARPEDERDNTDGSTRARGMGQLGAAAGRSVHARGKSQRGQQQQRLLVRATRSAALRGKAESAVSACTA